VGTIAAAGVGLIAIDLLLGYLRRHDYTSADLDTWAARIEPFLAAGDDVYAFFRHDAAGAEASPAASPAA